MISRCPIWVVREQISFVTWLLSQTLHKYKKSKGEESKVLLQDITYLSEIRFDQNSIRLRPCEMMMSCIVLRVLTFLDGITKR